MLNLFETLDRDSILERLAKLEADSPRQWGKMDVAQMLAHCSVPMEAAVGDRPTKQKLLGKILAPFMRSGSFNEKPFGRGGPTGPEFVISDRRDFAVEKQRLTELVVRCCERGPEEAARYEHSFFGRMSGDEWGRLLYKHLDHHLRQFDA